MDLGVFWENKTGLPIPLGGIVASRKLAKERQNKIESILRKSVEYAFTNPKSSAEYVMYHAQEMDKKVLDAHINLYVNDFSISLGEEGRSAVKKVFKENRINTQSIFI